MTENTSPIVSLNDSTDGLTLGPAFKIGNLGPQSQKIFNAITNVIVGQDRAAATLAKCFSRRNAGLTLNPKLPIANPLLLGKTGTGKTETVKQLAYHLIDPDASSPPYTVIPCSEYSAEHSVAQLIGAPLGYHGSHDQVGLLAQANIDGPAFWAKLRKHPDFIKARAKKSMTETQLCGLAAELYVETGPHWSVILADEFERGHRNLWNIFLHIMSDGELSMIGENPSKTSFAHSVIVFTSNVGEWEQQDKAGRHDIGFSTPKSASDVKRDENENYRIFRDAARQKFPPAFMGRVGKQLVAFNSLTRADVASAAEKRFTAVRKLMANRPDGGFEVFFAPEFKEYIVDAGYSDLLGMRPLDQEVEAKIMDPLTYLLECDQIKPGSKVIFRVAGKKLDDEHDERRGEVCPVL